MNNIFKVDCKKYYNLLPSFDLKFGEGKGKGFDIKNIGSGYGCFSNSLGFYSKPLPWIFIDKTKTYLI